MPDHPRNDFKDHLWNDFHEVRECCEVHAGPTCGNKTPILKTPNSGWEKWILTKETWFPFVRGWRSWKLQWEQLLPQPGSSYRNWMWPGEGSTAPWKWSPPSPGSLKPLLFPHLLNKAQRRERKGRNRGTTRSFLHSFPLSGTPDVQSYWAMDLGKNFHSRPGCRWKSLLRNSGVGGEDQSARSKPTRIYTAPFE